MGTAHIMCMYLCERNSILEPGCAVYLRNDQNDLHWIKSWHQKHRTFVYHDKQLSHQMSCDQKSAQKQAKPMASQVMWPSEVHTIKQTWPHMAWHLTSNCISHFSMHPSRSLQTANCDTPHRMMGEFGDDRTGILWVENKIFCVKKSLDLQ